MYNLKIGVIETIQDILEMGVSKLELVGLTEIQLNCWRIDLCTEENARKIKDLFGDKYTISGIWGGWNVGPTVWNFVDGPQTIGLVPREWRQSRMEGLKKVMDFAHHLNVKTVTTHMGFMPENPNTIEYREILDCLYELCSYADKYGILFCFETGQETPTTLLRAIQDMEKRGLHNLRINLDPANLLLYGKGNPLDALDVFGQYVVGIHVKDGDYPTDGDNLGSEYKVGTGRVNFEVLISKLQKLGYQGPLTIEREISGEQQIKDILDTINFLENILEKL